MCLPSPGQTPPRQTPPGRHPLGQTPPCPVHAGIHTHTLVECMLGYGQQAGSTHPTGMHSCSLSKFSAIHFNYFSNIFLNILECICFKNYVEWIIRQKFTFGNVQLITQAVAYISQKADSFRISFTKKPRRVLFTDYLSFLQNQYKIFYS